MTVVNSFFQEFRKESTCLFLTSPGMEVTIRFLHTSELDTLSNVYLLEYPKVKLTINDFYEDNGLLVSAYRIDYLQDDWQFYTRELFFSKSPNVSYQNYSAKWIQGGYHGGTSDFPIIVHRSESSTLTTDKVLKGVFSSGDIIYVIGYCSNSTFISLPDENSLNYEVVSHRKENASNVFSFKLP